jgi:hypothetical protein
LFVGAVSDGGCGAAGATITVTAADVDPTIPGLADEYTPLIEWVPRLKRTVMLTVPDASK